MKNDTLIQESKVKLTLGLIKPKDSKKERKHQNPNWIDLDQNLKSAVESFDNESPAYVK